MNASDNNNDDDKDDKDDDDNDENVAADNSGQCIYATNVAIVHCNVLFRYYERLNSFQLLTHDERLTLMEMRSQKSWTDSLNSVTTRASNRNNHGSDESLSSWSIGIRDIILTNSFLFVISRCGSVLLHTYFRPTIDRLRFIHMGVHPLDLVPGQLMKLSFSDDECVQIRKIVVSDGVSFFISDEGHVWSCGMVHHMGYCHQEIQDHFSSDSRGGGGGGGSLLSSSPTVTHPVCLSRGPLNCDVLRNKKVIDIGFMPACLSAHSVLFLCDDRSLVRASVRQVGNILMDSHVSDLRYTQIRTTPSRGRTCMLTDSGSVVAFGQNKIGEMVVDASPNSTYMPTLMNAAQFNQERIVSVDLSEMNSFFTTENGTIFAGGRLGSHVYSTILTHRPTVIQIDRSLVPRNVFPTSDFCLFQMQLPVRSSGGSSGGVDDDSNNSNNSGESKGGGNIGNPAHTELFIQCASDKADTTQPTAFQFSNRRQIVRSCMDTDILQSDLRLGVVTFETEDSVGALFQRMLHRQCLDNGHHLSDVVIHFDSA